MTDTLIIRADASLTFGQGHTLRNRNLASAFRAANPRMRIIWAATAETFKLVPLLRETFHAVVMPRAPQDVQMRELAGKLGDFGADKPMMIVDGYHLDHTTLDAARAHGLCGVSAQIDEKLDRVLGNHDFVVDYLPHTDADYRTRGLIGPETTVMGNMHLVSPRFAELATLRSKYMATRPANAKKSVLLMNGGFNIGHMLEDIVSTLATQPENWRDCRFSVFMMSRADTFQSTLKAVAAAQLVGVDVMLFPDCENIPQHMVGADLYIGAAGMPPYEMGAIGGAPSVVMPAGHNQDLIGRAVADAGAAVNAGRYLMLNGKNILVRDTGWTGVVMRDVLAKAQRILSTPAMHAEMSAASRAFCDGRGTQKVVDAMLNRATTPAPALRG